MPGNCTPSLPFLYLLYKFFMSGEFPSFIFCFGLLYFLIIFLNADGVRLPFPTFYKGLQHLQHGFFFRLIQLKDILQKFLLQCV